ncbi:MAG TPA: SOS response-associated peptidase family protein [Magnetospirillaceae bacterium]|jgi:putative SOS response-associated peptidase YedK
MCGKFTAMASWRDVRDYVDLFSFQDETGGVETTTPDDGKPICIAMIWRKEMRDEGELYSFVMVTVETNELIGSITDRMPATLQPDDWGEWFGEEQSSPEQLKGLLKPFEGQWQIRQQEKPSKAKAVP